MCATTNQVQDVKNCLQLTFQELLWWRKWLTCTRSIMMNFFLASTTFPLLTKSVALFFDNDNDALRRWTLYISHCQMCWERKSKSILLHHTEHNDKIIRASFHCWLQNYSHESWHRIFLSHFLPHFLTKVLQKARAKLKCMRKCRNIGEVLTILNFHKRNTQISKKTCLCLTFL